MQSASNLPSSSPTRDKDLFSTLRRSFHGTHSKVNRRIVRRRTGGRTHDQKLKKMQQSSGANTLPLKLQQHVGGPQCKGEKHRYSHTPKKNTRTDRHKIIQLLIQELFLFRFQLFPINDFAHTPLQYQAARQAHQPNT